MLCYVYTVGRGDHTFHAFNGSSVVEYLLLSPRDLHYVSHFCIIQPNECSDHSGVELNLLRKHENTKMEKKSKNAKPNVKWDASKCDVFRELFASKLTEINLLKHSIENGNDVDVISQSFVYMLHECSETVLNQSQSLKIKNKTIKTNNIKNKWFNKACYDSRKGFKNVRNACIRHKSNDAFKERYLKAIPNIIQ